MALANDIQRCFEEGWTDGLPVVPPYATLVNQMLAALGWSGVEVVGEMKALGVEVRAEQIAATAVMAGCKPDYGLLLRPLAEALLVPEFNLNGIAVTTGGPGILVVVSGPVVRTLGFAHEANALGSTARVNATVGRFAGMMRHFCGGLGGALQEFGTIGHPGRLSFCIAEHPTTVWAPFHTQFGIEPPESAVTIMATEGPSSVNNHYGDSGAKILETIADSISQYGSTNFFWRGFGNPRRAGYVVVLPPEHMTLVAKDFTRDAARRFLFEHSVRSTDELARLGRIPRDPRREFRVEPGAPRAPVDLEEQLTFVESGCPGGSPGSHSRLGRELHRVEEDRNMMDRLLSECDTECEILVSPIPRPKVPVFHVSTRPTKRSVYFVDTWKPNSLAILRRTKALLEERGVSTSEIWSKQDPSRPLTPAELDRIVREGDGALVLLGVADCGACSSGSSLDAIFLQQRGVTAIPVLTAPFVDVLSKLLSIWQADGVLSSIVLEHPIQDLGSAGIEKRAHDLVQAIERLLS